MLTNILLLLAVSGSCGPVVISEVMFHPEQTMSNGEFVELVNVSDSTVDLSDWLLADLSEDWPDTILGSQMQLQPGAYAVILEGDYSIESGAYCDLIPETALQLQVDDNLIGHYLTDNGDTLFLIDSNGDTVNIMGWDSDITPGYTLEKVILDDCNLPGNWQVCLNYQGTPGSPNSVAYQRVDLALDTLAWQPGPSLGHFTVTAAVTNRGLIAAGGQLLAGEVLATDVPILAVGENRVVPFNWETPVGVLGLYPLTVSLIATGDWNLSNNSLQTELLVDAPDLAVTINEIMYAPLNGEPEWVELVNTTANEIYLKDWQLTDLNDEALLPTLTLAPYSYAVVTDDPIGGINGWPQDISVIVVTALPALNNDGDKVNLLDPGAGIIDEVDYSRFHITTVGRSLEKVHPSASSQEATSWVVSPASQGHTAGRPNSVLMSTDQSGLTIEPNPLQINLPESILSISYVTPFSSINLLIELYDLAGRRLGTIFNEGPVPGSGAITWDARSLDPVRYRTGQYALRFHARDAGSNRQWERIERLILVR